MLKSKDANELLSSDKYKFERNIYGFNLFIQPHQFKRGKQHCMASMKRRLGTFNRSVGGFIVSYDAIKVHPASITKGIQGGVHIRATVRVIVFKASDTHPFKSKILRIENNFAIGDTCGILTRFGLRGAPFTPYVGQEVKGVLLKYSARDEIYTLTCALVE